MLDFSHLPSSTLEILRGSRPCGRGPIRISLDDVSERERPGIYREFFGNTVFRTDIEPLRDHPFEVDVILQTLPGLQLFAGKRLGCRNRRTPAQAADGIDDFTLMVNLGGPYLVTQGRQEIVLGDGEATFLNCGDPSSYTHSPPGEVLGLRFPRASFAPLLAGAEDCYLRRIPAGTEALKLLQGYVDLAWHKGTFTNGELQHVVVTHLYDLMAVAVGATRDAAHTAQDRGMQTARLHAVKQDIDRNLAEQDLSIAALAARHRSTARSIQRMFEQEGTTFTEYLLAQRLALAYRLLGNPRRRAEKISALALDCGFGDVSYFNRAFRRRYGAAPSDVRAQAGRDGVRH